MGLFDIFTGSGQARAQKAARGVAGQFYDDNNTALDRGYGAARDTTTNYGNMAIGTIEGGRDAAGNAIRGGADDALGYIGTGRQAALGSYGQARGAFEQAGNAYAPLENLAGEYGAGRDTYLDALGMRGSEGLSRARDAFGNTLQTNFEMDQGLEAINRARNARGAGTVNGGNIDRDAQLFGQGLANSRTNQYLDRLSGLTGMELNATGAASAGRANSYNNIGLVYGQEAGLNERTGLNRASVAQDTGSRIAAMTSGAAGDVAGIQGNMGSRLAGYDIDQTQAEMALRKQYGDEIVNSLLAERDARDAGSANTINFGMEAAKLAASLGTGMPSFGGGNSLKALSSSTSGMY